MIRFDKEKLINDFLKVINDLHHFKIVFYQDQKELTELAKEKVIFDVC